MPTFATDIDLLHWEPAIMSDAAGVAQTLLSGTGSLSNTTFTLDAGSLTDAHVTTVYAITLGDPINGSFPIISVNSDTELTLSVLYDDLYADQDNAQPNSSISGDAVSFAIRTFWPQRQSVTDQLLAAAGVDAADISQIINAPMLRRPCVLGILQMIYNALAASATDPANFLARADLYERLFQRALRATIVEIDTNRDGIADVKRPLGVVQLRRT